MRAPRYSGDAAPYADGSRRSDGPRQLGSWVLLSRPYGECSNLDAVRTISGLALNSRSKSEAQNLVYSRTMATVQNSELSVSLHPALSIHGYSPDS